MVENKKIEGAEAFARGVTRCECPYTPGTDDFHNWTDGWAECKAWRERKTRDAGAIQRFDAR